MSLDIKRGVDLGHLTTMGIGGTAQYFAQIETLRDLEESLAFARREALPIFILGGGSNIIFVDNEYRGFVLHLANQRYSMSSSNHRLISGAAASMEELVTQTTEKGWQGIEWAGGLPGSLGGAVRGNAGAFGGEICDAIYLVRSVDPHTLALRDWSPRECEFGYRTSRFKYNHQIIWEIHLQFHVGQRDELIRIRESNIAYRKTHHPQAPSVGSIFQNLHVRDLPHDFFDRFRELRTKVRGEKIGAGALLDRLAMRGRSAGGAMISNEHANIIVNTGSATAEDIQTLVRTMKQSVRDHYAIDLVEEPAFVGSSV